MYYVLSVSNPPPGGPAPLEVGTYSSRQGWFGVSVGLKRSCGGNLVSGPTVCLERGLAMKGFGARFVGVLCVAECFLRRENRFGTSRLPCGPVKPDPHHTEPQPSLARASSFAAYSAAQTDTFLHKRNRMQLDQQQRSHGQIRCGN
jgi:hypothetical protein